MTTYGIQGGFEILNSPVTDTRCGIVLNRNADNFNLQGIQIVTHPILKSSMILCTSDTQLPLFINFNISGNILGIKSPQEDILRCSLRVCGSNADFSEEYIISETPLTPPNDQGQDGPYLASINSSFLLQPINTQMPVFTKINYVYSYLQFIGGRSWEDIPTSSENFMGVYVSNLDL